MRSEIFRTALFSTLLVTTLCGCLRPYHRRLPPARPVPVGLAQGIDELPAERSGAVTPTDVDVGRAAAASATPSPQDSSEPLSLAEVLEAVENRLPLLLAAQQDIEAAEALVLAAEGGFDPRVGGKARLELEGFYENERVDLELEQPTAVWGSSLFTGYRIGRGDFAVYDGKAETNVTGEVRVGARLSLLRGRSIDKRRAALWKARIERDRADPVVETKRLGFVEKASRAYWKWRGAGEKLRIVRELLQLARTRQQSLRATVDEGLLPEITLTDNERLVVEREALEIAAIRAFERASLSLSLYLRDEAGDPLIPALDRLPARFPVSSAHESVDLDIAIDAALAGRPELRDLALGRDAVELDMEFQDNRIQPKVDVELFASQDLGPSASSKGDKDPLEYGIGLQLEIPLLAREARGLVRRNRAKLAKIEQERRWLIDRIQTEVRDADSALRRAAEGITKAERSLELARELEVAENTQLENGNSDLLRVNLREDKRAKAASILVEARAAYFAALASYRAAVGLPSVGDADASVEGLR